MELSTHLCVGVVGEVERFAVSQWLAYHIWSIWLGQLWRNREGPVGEGSRSAPGAVRLTGGHGCDGEACLVLPGVTPLERFLIRYSSILNSYVA